MTALRFQIGWGEGVERGEIRHAQTSFEGYTFLKTKTRNFQKQSLDCKIQTLKRFKITLFIQTKHNLQNFGVIPFIKPQNNT